MCVCKKKLFRSEKQLLQIATVRRYLARGYAILDILSGSLTTITRSDFISEDQERYSFSLFPSVSLFLFVRARLLVEIRSTRRALTLDHHVRFG